MKNKKMISLLILFGLSCLLGMFFFKDFFQTQTGGDHHNVTDLESSYNADEEIDKALVLMGKNQEKATVVTHRTSNQRIVALTFDGLTDRMIIQQILDLLKKHDAKATFFVDGMQSAEDPQTLINIKKEGYKVENYTFSGMVNMENLPAERLVKEFWRAQKIIKVTVDQGPNLLKCNDTKYTDQLLQAAKACGFNGVVKSDAFFNVKQMQSPAAVDTFVRTIKSGSIISIKLKANAEPIIKEQGKTDLKPAIDKQPGLKTLVKEVDVEGKDIVEGVEKLLIALEKAKYTTIDVENLLIKNNTPLPVKTTFLQNSRTDTGNHKVIASLMEFFSFMQDKVATLFTSRTAYAAELVDHPAKEIKMILTTEPALSYTFGGLSNKAAVDDVLESLKRLGIKGTFFVMEIEMKKYPETVKKIIANGHEIGVAIRPKEKETLEESSQDIIRARKILQEQFGVVTNLVKQPWGAIADTTKEAVSALDCKLIGQSINVVQSKHKDYTSADQVMAEIFGKSIFSLGRGQIIHFRMDYYTNQRLIIDLLEVIKERKIDNIAYVTFYDNPANNRANDSQYTIKPVGEILRHTDYLYKYPISPTKIPVQLRNDGHEINHDKKNFIDELSKRYIGNKDVVYEDRMLGFSKMETRHLDQNGLIHTKDNVIFLTFDDWGTDAAINKILYVLRKHHVPATFFVLTHNVLNNPNLLRTIAMQGHTIGSHSDQHKPMVIRDAKSGKQIKTQEREEYSKELALSYQKLQDVIGDISANGKTPLTRFFRPPTLALSKMGAEVLFETGYEYIISGSCSTYDYKAESVSQLVETIKDGVYNSNGQVQKGAILTMHMGDSCVYTPAALDILLTANEAKKDSDPSKFKVGSLSDYLIDGYSQMNWKNH